MHSHQKNAAARQRIFSRYVFLFLFFVDHSITHGEISALDAAGNNFAEVKRLHAAAPQMNAARTEAQKSTPPLPLPFFSLNTIYLHFRS
jgi:hypothetical protein